MPADPWAIGAGAGLPEYSASELRRIMAVLLSQAGTGTRFGARAGVHPASGNGVTLAGTVITVQNLKAVIHPGLTSTSGPYVVQLPSRTHTLTAANATNPRKDIVVLRVWDDDEDASGLRQVDTEYVVGTPAASPAEPSLPANSYRLATIDVPTNNTAGSILTFNAPFMSTAGGVHLVRNDAELPGTSGGLYAGALRWNQATGALEVHDGASAWETLAAPSALAPGTLVAYLQRATAQSLTNSLAGSTATAVSWDTEVRDTLGGHDLVTNPTRYTPNIAGWYLFQGHVTFEPDTSGGVRGCAWKKTGTVPDGTVSRPHVNIVGNATTTANAVAFPTLMNGTTDYMELVGIHDAATALDTGTSGFRCTMTVSYMGPN